MTTQTTDATQQTETTTLTFGNEEAAPRDAFTDDTLDALREALTEGATVRFSYESKRTGDVKTASATVEKPPSSSYFSLKAREDDGRMLQADFGYITMANLCRLNPSQRTKLGYLVFIEVETTECAECAALPDGVCFECYRSGVEWPDSDDSDDGIDRGNGVETDGGTDEGGYCSQTVGVDGTILECEKPAGHSGDHAGYIPEENTPGLLWDRYDWENNR